LAVRREIPIVGAVLAALVFAFPSSAKTPAPAPIPRLPLSIAVAAEEGKPVQDDAWVDAQVAEAERLFGPLGVHLAIGERRAAGAKFAHLETRQDRDAWAAELHPGVVNVLVVGSLRDVDEPERMRMGVHWRPESAKQKHWVVVSASAMPSTLAHELGHFFGNPHSPVTNNVMSYSRTGEDVFFDERQASKIRSMARLYVRIKELLPLPE
jgi:hypothetical protein